MQSQYRPVRVRARPTPPRRSEACTALPRAAPSKSVLEGIVLWAVAVGALAASRSGRKRRSWPATDALCRGCPVIFALQIAWADGGVRT
jgi:hypothetical protein